MPNRKWILILFTLLLFVSCDNHYQSKSKQEYYLSPTKKFVSPGQTKFIGVFENGQTKTDAITQVMVNFGYPDSKGGGGIFAAKGTSLELSILWLHDNDLLIKYPDTLTILKQDSIVYFKRDFVNIYYEPQKISDSIKSKVLKYERIAIMDTITSILKGQIIDLESKNPINNKNISITSGLVMYTDTTDNKGFYEFFMIPYGDYRMHFSLDGYYNFSLDTLHLGSGDIKELNIGMIGIKK